MIHVVRRQMKSELIRLNDKFASKQPTMVG